ncbi:2TM domain-containing protein [Rubrivirga sp. IMCC43871]|uniref:2TM domain-containing protein n=1 Tax=Rubrivirga sp. IMCC43871 TaxID=3391575 RepID=UPI0039901239
MILSEARAQARSESQFYAHLGLFVVAAALAVVASLVWIDAQWAVVGIAAWALILASHGTAVFGHVLGADWRERRAASLAGALRMADLAGPSDNAFDLFDLAAAAGQRPSGPSPRDAMFADDLSGSDPFGSVRTPIDTPRLDGPRARA